MSTKDDERAAESIAHALVPVEPYAENPQVPRWEARNWVRRAVLKGIRIGREEVNQSGETFPCPNCTKLRKELIPNCEEINSRLAEIERLIRERGV